MNTFKLLETEHTLSHISDFLINFAFANLIKMSQKLTDINHNLSMPEPGSLYLSDTDNGKDLQPRPKIRLDNVLLVPLEDEVFFPHMKIGFTVTHPDAVSTVKKAIKDKEPVFLFLASDSMPDDSRLIEISDIYKQEGCMASILEFKENEDGTIWILALTHHQGSIFNMMRRLPYLRGGVEIIIPELIPPTEEEFQIEQKLDSLYDTVIQNLNEQDRKQLKELMSAMPPRSEKLLNFMMQNSPVSTDGRYRLMLAHSLSDRRLLFIELLSQELQNMQIRADIHQKTIAEIGSRQRDEFLRTQMQQIKNELGETEDSDIEELRCKAQLKEWTDETRDRFEKELRKLERFNPTSPDYAVQYTYIDTFLDLPWLHCDNSEFTLKKVEEILDRDHFGLEKVKERIVEQMAVLKLRGDTKAPILCLYGPPGVGKTSLGKSVAEALGRKYVRVALGGLHDESEIRGHRRTYLGSMPGRIINALIKCGTSDPVMVLDEIDKIGADYKGDPQQALLEVLDPEQNCKFHDNFVDQDYDLSKVLFIATANSLQTVSAPLLDRMELIEIGGYIEAEKIQIAQRHLIPRELEEHGFSKDEMSFTDDALMEIITSYTRESGVRRLEKKINEILRKQARLKASGKPFAKVVDVDIVKEFLGKPEAFNDHYENNDIPGIVTGLAWTQAGGEILFIESSVAPGKEGKLTLTGNLGDVMKESAILALQYIKANHEHLGISEKDLEFGTVHVHVPEGAVPKDGPSAGITIVTSLASTFTGRKVRSHLAMTGEITLRGKVLPVGGIEEKILAAKRAGIKTVMLCEKNRKDIEEIKPHYIEGLDFHFVESVDEALDFALLP